MRVLRLVKVAPSPQNASVTLLRAPEAIWNARASLAHRHPLRTPTPREAARDEAGRRMPRYSYDLR